MSDVVIDKGTLAPEDYENTKIVTLADGTQEEVYISRAGNIVTPPDKRSPTGRISDERKEKCWELYVKSWRSGSPNARGSALSAGYSENTAINIGNQKWFKERKDKLRRSNMLSKAERNLSRILDIDYSRMKMLDSGVEEQVIDKDILKVVADTSKFISSTLGKEEGYSTKTEVQGNMQGEIKINSISYADPLQVENQVVDEAVKMIEGEIIKAVTPHEEK